MRVGQAIVNGFQSSRTRVGQIGNLNRRGFAGENQQPIAGGMSRQIDQYVDGIRTDKCRGVFVEKMSDVAPGIAKSLEAIGMVVGMSGIGIAEDLEIRVVMILQQRQQKVADRVVVKVTRDITDAQAPLGARSLS